MRSLSYSVAGVCTHWAGEVVNVCHARLRQDLRGGATADLPDVPVHIPECEVSVTELPDSVLVGAAMLDDMLPVGRCR